jgi:hypothetical protein
MSTEQKSFKYGFFYVICLFIHTIYLTYQCFYPESELYNIYTDLYLNTGLIFFNTIQGVGIILRQAYGLMMVYLSPLVNIIIIPLIFYIVMPNPIFLGLSMLTNIFFTIPLHIVTIVYFYRRKHMFI